VRVASTACSQAAATAADCERSRDHWRHSSFTAAGEVSVGRRADDRRQRRDLRRAQTGTGSERRRVSDVVEQRSFQRVRRWRRWRCDVGRPRQLDATYNARRERRWDGLSRQKHACIKTASVCSDWRSVRCRSSRSLFR